MIGKGNKRNYQVNNCDLGRRNKRLSAIARRKKKKNDFVLRTKLAYRDVYVCIDIFKEANIALLHHKTGLNDRSITMEGYIFLL